MIKISYDELQSEFKRVLLKTGFTKPKADLSAKLFSDNPLDVVHSHGINRFPTLINYVEKGYIDVNAEPELVYKDRGYEAWNGRLGRGN